MEVVEKVAETEAIYGQSDAFFTEKLNLNYRIEKMQRYRVTMYVLLPKINRKLKNNSNKINNFFFKNSYFRNVLNSSTKTIMGSMGTADFDISMMFACGGRLILLIASPLAPCSLEIVGKVPDYYSQFLRIRFSGNYLHSPSDVIPLQLYYILSIPTEERTIMLYKSEMLRETKYPEWAAFSIPLFLLNYFNESSIQLHVYNYTPNHDDQLVGHCTTTLTQLQQGVGHFNSYMV